jgi:hypothetical protein
LVQRSAHLLQYSEFCPLSASVLEEAADECLLGITKNQRNKTVAATCKKGSNLSKKVFGRGIIAEDALGIVKGFDEPSAKAGNIPEG